MNEATGFSPNPLRTHPNTARIQKMFDFLTELVNPKLAEGYYIPIGSPIGTSTRRNLCSEAISNDPKELSSWHHDNWHFWIWSKASTLQPLNEGDVMWHARKAIPNSKPSISNMSKQILNTPSQEWQVDRVGSKVLWIISKFLDQDLNSESCPRSASQ